MNCEYPNPSIWLLNLHFFKKTTFFVPLQCFGTCDKTKIFSVCVTVNGSFSSNTQFTFEVLEEIWVIFQPMTINSAVINFLIHLFDEYACVLCVYMFY